MSTNDPDSWGRYGHGPVRNPQDRPDGKATASVVLGYVGLVVGICAPIGLVLALVARSQAKRGQISPRRVTHGLIVSSIVTALAVLGFIVALSSLGSMDQRPADDFTVTVR